MFIRIKQLNKFLPVNVRQLEKPGNSVNFGLIMFTQCYPVYNITFSHFPLTH